MRWGCEQEGRKGGEYKAGWAGKEKNAACHAQERVAEPGNLLALRKTVLSTRSAIGANKAPSVRLTVWRCERLFAFPLWPICSLHTAALSNSSRPSSQLPALTPRMAIICRSPCFKPSSLTVSYKERVAAATDVAVVTLVAPVEDIINIEGHTSIGHARIPNKSLLVFADSNHKQSCNIQAPPTSCRVVRRTKNATMHVLAPARTTRATTSTLQ